MEQTFTIEIKGNNCISIFIEIENHSLVVAPPNVKILNKPESGKHVLQEGDKLKLECQVRYVLLMSSHDLYLVN